MSHFPIHSLRRSCLVNRSCRYEQLVLRANTLREELHTEIDRILNDIIKFKLHIQDGLSSYEEFVTDELEKELGSDEMMKDDTRAVDL